MKRLVLRTFLPALLAVALFSGVVFYYILPSLSRAIMDQKRLMIRELTESAWNILARFEAEERAGQVSRAQGQAAAIAQVRNLHYGQESKDYFWIIDMQPRMIVHPYRPDLEGTDLRGFADPHGRRLFVEMVETVKRDGAGYVAYQWQWKDDNRRIVPKLSYVKGFAPWGWIIGTGVYTEDIDAEISALTERLQAAALAILAVVTLLVYIMLRTSVQAERGRQRAAIALRASEEKHRSLVEAAGESILMAVEGEGLFANPSMLRLLGYTRQEFAALDIESIIRPTAAERDAGRRTWQAIQDGEAAPARLEAELVHRDGSVLRVMLSLSRIVVQGKAGFMAVATRLARPRELDLRTASTADDLVAANRRMAVMASLMVSHGAHVPQVMRMLAANADIVVRKSIEIAIGELGSPPGPFEFLLMGSLGRSEVSLLADQDHAIIHPEIDGAQEYFLRLGGRVSEILDAGGYPYCQGGIMASRPECCQTLAGWRSMFSKWIHTLTAGDLLHAKIFFDFRGLMGEANLVQELRDHLHAEIGRQPRFCHLLTRSSLQYEPPLSSFGAFVLQEKVADRATFDVKGVIAQIVDIARIRALQHAVSEVGTLPRLEALAARGAIKAQTAEATAHDFQLLMELRLQAQAQRILTQLEPDNSLEPARLAAEIQKELKRVLSHIKALQADLDHDFAGA